MLEISNLQTIQNTSNSSSSAPVKILGIGNAGVNFVDRFTIESALCHVETVAVNTDLLSLRASVADFKIPLGQKVTHGLGTGGDPALGIEAAYESEAALRSAVEGAGMVILCAGLGGGTSAGVLPLLLEATRMNGVPTAVLVSLPFSFEGPRRVRQAQEILEKIRTQAEILLVFENDRMLQNADSAAVGIGEIFNVSDRFLSQAATALARLVGHPRGNSSTVEREEEGVRNSVGAPLQLSVGDLKAILCPTAEGGDGTVRGSTSLFGFGEAKGPDRARQALEQALQCPLLPRGHLLQEAARLLIHIQGTSDLLLSEVQAIVEEISTTCHPSTHLLLGVDASTPVHVGITAPPLAVSLLGVCGKLLLKRAEREESLPEIEEALQPILLAPEPEEEAASPPPVLEEIPSSLSLEPEPEPHLAPEPQLTPSSVATTILSEPELPEKEEEVFSPSSLPDEIPPEASVSEEMVEVSREDSECSSSLPAGEPMLSPPPPQQAVLQFEPVTRGRFEKSEPTIFEGKDIDVPTFLRLKIKLK